MSIARLEPWTLVDLLSREASKHRSAANPHSNETDWVPAVDIVEEKDRFVLRADVPGVDPSKIDINTDNGCLNVSGERSPVEVTEETAAQRIERATGRFLRRFTLPDSVAAEGITARCSNGILEVTIPKAPAVQARRITVKAA